MRSFNLMCVAFVTCSCWAGLINAQEATIRYHLDQNRTAPGRQVKDQMKAISPTNAIVRSSFEALQGTETVVEADAVDPSLISNYWIGVQCEKAEATIYSPKELPETDLVIDGGMKVLAVTEGSAADEAGFQKGDVLVKFAGKTLKSLNDLYAVIGGVEDNETKVVLVRDKELLLLEITPQERPAPTSESTPLASVQDVFHAELSGKQLPEGYRMQVELVRGKEVKIKLMQGDETWNASDSSVDELPDEVQGVATEIVAQCKPLVKGDELAYKFDLATIEWQLAANGANGRWLAPHVQPLWAVNIKQSTEQKLKSIESQLDALTEAIESLKSELQKD